MPAKETATVCVNEKACEQLQSTCQKLLLQLMGVGFFHVCIHTFICIHIYPICDLFKNLSMALKLTKFILSLRIVFPSKKN